ncbi:universal stress protein [Microbispora sp. RL4-1S]|uniref:Universal stress protein n=1 Tax=Microbispora oryzae TaxID=2806554 RepID=A0A941AIJ6_9ACTN|nr:universal stress protein [Microbispora oryzae]MBP2703932.1 universal stress protein [Microbispora oryzae]
MAGFVVVGVDGSAAASAALDYAVDDAVRRAADVRIVHVREPWAGNWAFPGPEGLDQAIHRYCQGVLDAAERHARDRSPGVRVAKHLVTGDVIGRLKFESRDADELVIGSRGMGGFAGMVLGSVGLGVAGHVAGPVVVVRRPASPLYGEIVVGYDGSDHAEAALAHGFAEARRRSARLRVVYAWQMPVLPPLTPGRDELSQEVFEGRAAAVLQQLGRWRDKQPDVPVEEEAVCDHPVHALSEASRSADLLVVGSRALGAMSAAVLGSVGHGVLHRAHCPVAIVRPGKEET